MRDYKVKHFRFPRTMRDSSVRGEFERELAYATEIIGRERNRNDELNRVKQKAKRYLVLLSQVHEASIRSEVMDSDYALVEMSHGLREDIETEMRESKHERL